MRARPKRAAVSFTITRLSSRHGEVQNYAEAGARRAIWPLDRGFWSRPLKLDRAIYCLITFTQDPARRLAAASTFEKTISSWLRNQFVRYAAERCAGTRTCRLNHLQEGGTYERRCHLHCIAGPAAVRARALCLDLEDAHAAQCRLRHKSSRSLASRGPSARQHRRICAFLLPTLPLVRHASSINLGFGIDCDRHSFPLPSGRWIVVGPEARPAKPDANGGGAPHPSLRLCVCGGGGA